MKVVLDTNVVVSGLLNPHGAPGNVLKLVLSRAVTICYDARLLSEYREVLLRREFGFDSAHLESILSFIEDQGMLISALPFHETLPDADDLPFLEVACSAKAEVLITGNLKHFPVSKRKKQVVLSPAEFLSFYSK